jgi:hypothetical protein
MALSPNAMGEVDSILEGTSRKILNLPNTFPRAGLHATAEELGLNIPTVWEDYCGSAVRSWTQIINDEGTLGTTARISLRQVTGKFKNWPLELATHTQSTRHLPIRHRQKCSHTNHNIPPPNWGHNNMGRQPDIYLHYV